jgi:hypothetical protein
MAEQSEQTKMQDATSGRGGATALKAAAAAAAAGAAALVATKALSGHGNGSKSAGRENGDSRDAGESKSTALSSIAAGGWDAARDALLPAVEDAAGAAGTFLAENGPEVVRDRILPRFVESFSEAHGS